MGQGRVTRRLIVAGCVLMAGFLVGGALPAGPAGAAPTPWAIATSPDQAVTSPALNAVLNDVTCTSTASCVAVGEYFNGSADQALIENWNGAVWSLVASPDPSLLGAELTSVTCTSATSCVAVGSYFNGLQDQTLIETLSSTTWSVTANVGGGDGVLDGVSCSSATSCVAVGYTSDATGAETLIETYNGTTWGAISNPDPAGGLSEFNAVSCSGTTCVAVGFAVDGSDVGQTLIESSTGSAWSIVTSPNPAGALGSDLDSVSCTSATGCVAVGFSIDSADDIDTLVASWSGSAWSIVSSPDATGSSASFLDGVSCSGATSCVAVGDDVNGSDVTDTLVETWSGTTWSVTSSPDPGGSAGDGFDNVTCTGTTGCVAVGSNGDATLVASAPAGTWSAVTGAGAAGTDNALNAVACPSPTVCVAVGSAFNGSTDQTLAETLNGSTWTLSASADPAGSSDSILTAVSCTSATSCLAVGYWVDGSTDETLVESWNGATWSIVSSPDPAGSGALLYGVSCAGTGTCLAVGFELTATASGTTQQALAESSTGGTWSLVTMPALSGEAASLLDAVSCPSTTYCLAVGSASDGSDNGNLAESWNGTTLSLAPVGTGNDSDLNGVSCTSATSCVLVGSDIESVTEESTWVGTWNGTSAYNPGYTDATSWDNQLNSVSCLSADSCLAVGDDTNGAQAAQTLVESFDGTTWSVIASPEQGSAGDTLNSVACTANGQCVAVGNDDATAVSQTLIEHGPVPVAPLAVTTTSLPDATAGQPYTATLDADGGVAPYGWSVSSGSLPAGLTLDASTGVISGTPTGGGPVSFTAQVTDGASPTADSATASLSITVEGLHITTTSLPAEAIGNSYSETLAATGGNPPYTWKIVAGSGALPKGMKLTGTGVIKGRPKAMGTFTFTVEVLDKKTKTKPHTQNTATQVLSITVT